MPTLDKQNVIGIDGGAASATTLTGPTLQDIAPGATLYLAITGDGGGVPSGTIGGVAITVDDQFVTDPRVYLARAYFPTGLAATVGAVSLAYATAATNRAATAFSMTDVDSVAPLDNAPAGNQATALTYTSASIAINNPSEVAVTASVDWVGGAAHTPTAPSLEGAEFSAVGADKSLALVYRVASAGPVTNAGAYASVAGNQPISTASASYKPGVQTSVAIRDMDVSEFPKLVLRR